MNYPKYLFSLIVLFTFLNCSNSNKINDNNDSNHDVINQGSMDGFMPPKLIGGLNGLHAKIKYPESARKNKIEGRVYLQFVVDENGNVKDEEIINGSGNVELDAEALRVIKLATFKPAFHQGEPVKTRYSLPLLFQL